MQSIGPSTVKLGRAWNTAGIANLLLVHSNWSYTPILHQQAVVFLQGQEQLREIYTVDSKAVSKKVQESAEGAGRNKSGRVCSSATYLSVPECPNIAAQPMLCQSECTPWASHRVHAHSCDVM